MGSLSLENYINNDFNPLDPEEFRAQAHHMVDFIADYYKCIESYPVVSQVQPGYLRTQLPETAPDEPQPLDDILADITKHIMPGMTHWLNPNFFAFFPATVSTAAFLGEMMCTSFNCVGFNWLASPAATELEMVVMDWLASMLNLPESFMFKGTGGGVLQGTTSEAILCTLIAARDKALKQIGQDNTNKLVVYASDQTHSTFTKACKLAGILPHNIRLIPTTRASNFALIPQLLTQTMSSDIAAGLHPLYLCVTIGTTSTTAIDPISHLTDIAKTHQVWVHVDAAYAGSACICPENRHYLNGVERVDSISLAPHKWLLTYLDCCCLWISKPQAMINALSTNPEYLKNKPSETNSVVDYKDWQIGTGRRFRSIRLWMVIRSYGVNNLHKHIRSDIHMANLFEEMVKSDGRFEIIVPTRFALVCFRLISPFSEGDDDAGEIEKMNRKLLDLVNSTGKIYITHTIAGGIYMLRFAVGTTLTEMHHVENAWKLIKKGADTLLVEVDGYKGALLQN